MSNFTQIFGGTAIRPSQPSYLALTLSSNTTLVWPLETTGGQPYVAAQIDVTASAAGLSLAMPPANTGSTGAQTIATNVGSNSFTLTDNQGNQIAVIAAGVSWLVTLISNTTDAGIWRAYQLGATTSNATAGSLAGLGLQAVSTELQVQLPPFALNANTTLVSTYRSGFITWTGAAGTLQLDASANLTSGWFCLVTNIGTGALTISCSGSDEINGAAALVLQVGNSAIVECNGSGFSTVGNTQSPLSIENGGTGAITAPAALTNFGGTALGVSIFTAPSAAAILTLLGISGVAFTESSVATNQSVTTGNSQTAYVATAALTLTLPLITGGTVTTSFCLMIYAFGGAVTLTPQALDKINGGTAGSSLVIPEGTFSFLTTDANGNWYAFLGGVTQSGSVVVGRPATWTAAGQIGDAGGLVQVSVAGGSDVTLSQAQAANETIVFAGALTASINVNFPSGLKNQWIVVNNTSGAYTLTPRVAGGTGPVILQGGTALIFSDGTNMYRGSSDLSGASGTTASLASNNALLATTAYADRSVSATAATLAPLASPALTGIPNAPTAAPGTNTTQLATTAFAAAAAAAASFGSSITNHNVVGSRVLGSTGSPPPYTNAQTSNMYVSVWATLSAQGNLTLTVGSTQVSHEGGPSGILLNVHGFVPPGATYYAATDVTSTLVGWVETY